MFTGSFACNHCGNNIVLLWFFPNKGGETQRKVSQYRPAAAQNNETEPQQKLQSQHPKVNHKKEIKQKENSHVN